MFTIDKPRLVLRGAILCLAAVAALLISAWAQNAAAGTPAPATGPYVGVAQEDPQDDGTNVFVDDFTGIEDLVGEEVTVTGEVSEVLAPFAFVLAGGPESDPAELLVLHDIDAPDVTEGSRVEVTGTLQEDFAVADAEDFGGADIDETQFGDELGDLYLEASSIELQ